ncbi:hypothetical protein [Tenacibaculum sp. 190524A02b]|uniref:hypothetical protein n=1 Tax=Tenacibaculum vairaonense TaxID=3137860 RepID=UPI0031FA6647
MKTKIKIAIVAMIGISLGLNAQNWNPNGDNTTTGKTTAKEYSFPLSTYDFSKAPRTQLGSMSIKLFDDYYTRRPGGTSPDNNSYGTLLSLYGYVNHWESNIYFGASTRKMYFRTSTWSGGTAENRVKGDFHEWRTLLDSKSDLISTGVLKLSGSGNHYFSDGNVGIGTETPNSSLTIEGKTNRSLMELKVKNESNTWKDQVKIIGDLNTPYGLAFIGNGHHRGGLYAKNLATGGDGEITLWSRNNGKIVLDGNEVEVKGEVNAKEYSFPRTQYDFTKKPRTQIKPMTIKLFDDYSNKRIGGKGGPDGNNYGTLLAVNGITNHWESNIYFGASTKKMYFRTSTWTGQTAENGVKGDFNEWRTLLDSKSHIVSSGLLKISGNGTHLISNGKVGIGTETTGNHRLAVEGSIGAREIKVEATPNWSDFVFEKDYYLPTLKEVENHINTKGHLKDIPSAKEVAKNGFYLGEMDAKLLQKIEELTLYTIEQEKQLTSQNKEIQQLKAQNTKIEQLEKENKVLKSLLERVQKLEEKVNKN